MNKYVLQPTDSAGCFAHIDIDTTKICVFVHINTTFVKFFVNTIFVTMPTAEIQFMNCRPSSDSQQSLSCSLEIMALLDRYLHSNLIFYRVMPLVSFTCFLSRWLPWNVSAAMRWEWRLAELNRCCGPYSSAGALTIGALALHVNFQLLCAQIATHTSICQSDLTPAAARAWLFDKIIFPQLRSNFKFWHM